MVICARTNITDISTGGDDYERFIWCFVEVVNGARKKSNCSISKYRTGFLCVFPLSNTSHIFMGNGSTSHIKMFCCSQWVSTLWTNGAKTSLFFRKKGLDALYFYLEQKKASPQAAPLQTCSLQRPKNIFICFEICFLLCVHVSYQCKVQLYIFRGRESRHRTHYYCYKTYIWPTNSKAILLLKSIKNTSISGPFRP